MSRRLSKKLSMRVLRLKEKYPTAKVELWCEDEHRLGLKPIVRKVWSPIGQRPLVEVDQAGWHTAKQKLEVPEGIHLEFLPSHSPELQPAERLWPLSNEGVANRYFEEIEDLEEALVERCLALLDQPELIRSYTRYHWWPNAV